MFCFGALNTKLLVNIHHIANDGWSTDILLKELNAYYDHYANNVPLPLSELSIQYKDFAVWQREYLQGKELDKLPLNNFHTPFYESKRKAAVCYPKC